MLKEGIIRLTIHHHHFTIVVFQNHPVAHLIEVFGGQAILSTEGIQSKPVLVPASAGMLQDVIYKGNIVIINLNPRLYISIHY